MNGMPPHESLVIASSLFAGMFMLHVSLRKRAIKWKTPRRCPSCGRHRGLSRICNNCT
jgi:hypothetical protein